MVDAPQAFVPISVVIPTYRREQVLLDTLDRVLALSPAAAELVVIDQTTRHETMVEDTLSELDKRKRIRWIRLSSPSIPHAMNEGLLRARHNVVLFLDDDIIPSATLLKAHERSHQEGAVVVAGQVLQPGEESEALEGTAFAFCSSVPQSVSELMAGNFSIARDVALGVGGFDENFVGAAYRFEREFSERLLSTGEKIQFRPEASIQHLQAPSGGTRSFGSHLRTLRPAHSVGEYYYILCSQASGQKLHRVLTRLAASIQTRHHLRRPWWIPVTLTAEVLGIVWALLLRLKGPGYLKATAEVAK